MLKLLLLKYVIYKENKKHKKQQCKVDNNCKINLAQKSKDFENDIRSQFLEAMITNLYCNPHSNFYASIVIKKEYSGFEDIKQYDLLEKYIGIVLEKKKLINKINFHIELEKIEKNTFNIQFNIKNKYYFKG